MRTPFLLLLLSCLLIACTDPAPKPDAPEQLNLSPAEQVQLLMNEAAQSVSPVREQKQLRATALLLAQSKLELAEEILLNMSPQTFSADEYASYSLLYSKLHIQRGAIEQARQVLDDKRLLDLLDSQPVSMQLDIGLLRADIFALLGQHIASARQRIFLAPLLDESHRQDNDVALWHSLMYVATADLEQYLLASLGGEYQGWLELALIAKDNQGDLDRQLSQLDAWQQRWPAHPASAQLPGGLELIKELAASRPRQLALLLPLTGKLATFGKAIRDGFIAARYQTAQRGGQVPELKIYNTEASEDFLALYQHAVDAGAEMVIGPLEKPRLRQLFDQVTLPVPTLGLNRVDDYGQPPEQLFQFGLLQQDEARQIAEIAFRQNHQRALVVAPRSSWGEKVSQSFIERWQLLGGEVVVESLFNGQQDYSNSIKQALLLQSSEDRAKRIRRLAGEKVEFSPRRRRDVDMVFLLARPQQARSIKPLLAYHYAGDVPVYGTSRLYDGFDSPVKNRDINGIRFTDMPWILNSPPQLKQQISEHIDHSKAYQRMYALGIDSFQLHPRLRQLQETPNSRVYGQTGTLKLNSQRAIERQMLLAQIKSGRAQLIAPVDQSLKLSKDARHDIQTPAD